MRATSAPAPIDLPPNVLSLTVEGAAAATSLSPGKIRDLIHSGDLRAVQVGRRYLIPRSALLALLGEDG